MQLNNNKRCITLVIKSLITFNSLPILVNISRLSIHRVNSRDIINYSFMKYIYLGTM